MPRGVDLVVGICTKNCASTVARVLKAVDEGLTHFFGGHGALIVVSGGFSTDGTREVAAATPTQVEVVVLTQRGGPGKGVGVRTVLEEAQNRDARAVALVDGDLTSIRPEWLKLLLEPILAGAELVVPLYLRHPHDGVITNHVVYPLVNVLFGLGVRQPIGGEF
ncbi:glycosyltransferase, partial [Candidatus Bipolaricaulota bacterium]|nr:glycosyltransferase [Candidatus Bipolaricaulota bacterium]